MSLERKGTEWFARLRFTLLLSAPAPHGKGKEAALLLSAPAPQGKGKEAAVLLSAPAPEGKGKEAAGRRELQGCVARCQAQVATATLRVKERKIYLFLS